MMTNRAYLAADAQLQRYKRSTQFRRAVGKLSRLAWKRRKAARITKQSLSSIIASELRKLS